MGPLKKAIIDDMPKVIIVDENDTPIGLKERADFLPGDIHRVTALWLTNSQGEILLAQRAFTKKHAPGMWGPAVYGTVDEGETYESNVIKETKEEIGLSISLDELKKGPKYLAGEGTENGRFVQWFSAVRDVAIDELTLPPDEVIAARWITLADLKREVLEAPDRFVSAMSRTPPIYEAF